MCETAALLSLYFSFAMLHAAHSRGLSPGYWEGKVCNRSGMRFLAALSVGAAVWQLRHVYDLATALLTALTGVAAFATLFVLFVPLFPRVVWGLALACPPLFVALLSAQHD